MNQRIKIGKKTVNSGAMDFSHLLDGPAGKHGFVKVKDGHFYFENGERVKFIGFNFPVRANLPDKETAELISKRLASMGVNMVRLTACDVEATPWGWSCNPEYPFIDYSKGNSREVTQRGWERLDYWIARLKEKGIYLQIDLLVARTFMEGDDLDYPGDLHAIKSCSHLNERLIELQKEYATAYLTHVNPYTGLALIDDPAVMGIQVSNEDSIFFWNGSKDPNVAYYREEMQKRFNHYLLAKYNTRKNLAKAWTFEGQCALGEDEDPEKGTVKCITLGEYHQTMNHPMGKWKASQGPARYADFVEFGIMLNRKYNIQMLEHVRTLGAKVPLTTSCLLTGAADIYSQMDGDFMENNAYFNHPAPGFGAEGVTVPYLREYITADPRKETYPDFEPRTNLTTQASATLIEGKPFIMSEWNEYGVYPFHSSAFMMTAAYACLNDWDGLNIYSYHGSDHWNDQPEDFIRSVYDAYNDPSLILQFGTMAEVFLKGLIQKSENKIDVVYTKNDLLTQPEDHRMPFSVLPFLTKVRNVYLEHGQKYHGDARAAVSAGFVSAGDYEQAEHAVLYAHSPYRDAFRTNYMGQKHLDKYLEEGRQELEQGVTLGDKYLVISDLKNLIPDHDYTDFAKVLDKALKKWGIIDSDKGIREDNAYVSDTGQLIFNPDAAYFTAKCGRFSYFTGKPVENILLGERYRVNCSNERITLSVLSLDERELKESRHILLTAIGRSGMDEAEYILLEDGIHTKMIPKGKLYMDTLEGSLKIADGKEARIWALDVYGEKIRELSGTLQEDGSMYYVLDGNYMGNFEVRL